MGSKPLYRPLKHSAFDRWMTSRTRFLRTESLTQRLILAGFTCLAPLSVRRVSDALFDFSSVIIHGSVKYLTSRSQIRQGACLRCPLSCLCVSAKTVSPNCQPAKWRQSLLWRTASSCPLQLIVHVRRSCSRLSRFCRMVLRASRNFVELQVLSQIARTR